MKKEATYDPSRTVRLNEGQCALIWPMSHHDPVNVSLTRAIITSRVEVIHEDGSFETQNTIYRPYKAKESA
jgi:hypothetical protein